MKLVCFEIEAWEEEMLHNLCYSQDCTMVIGMHAARIAKGFGNG